MVAVIVAGMVARAGIVMMRWLEAMVARAGIVVMAVVVHIVSPPVYAIRRRCSQIFFQCVGHFRAYLYPA
jgi:hypothetical protein